MSRRLWIANLLVVAAMILAACGGAATTAPQATTAPAAATKAPAAAASPVPATAQPVVAGGTIIMGASSDIATTIPVLARDSTSNNLIALMFDRLIRNDPVTMDLKPWLAKSWETLDSGKTVIFHLRDDVKWWDGVKFTSADVKFSIEAALDKNLNSILLGRYGPITAVEAVDPVTVKITLSQPYAPLISYLADNSSEMMPAHILKGQDLLKTDFLKNPVGTGPFKFKEWVPGDHVTVVANPDYFLGKPKIDSVIQRVVPDAATMVGALKTGEIDLISISQANLPQVANDPKIKVVEVPSNCFQTMGVNWSQERWKDKRVRQALLYAMPRQDMVKTLTEGHGYVVDSYILKTSWAYNPNTKPQYPFDLAKAKALMAEAGWKPNAKGILEKNGEPFKFNLLATASTTAGINEVIQKALTDLGMEVTLELYDWPTFLQKAFTDKKYDMFQVNMCVASDPHNPTVWGCGTNAFFFCDPAFDEMGAKAAAVIDREERKKIYFQMQDYMADLQARVLLYSPTSIRAYNTRLKLGEPSAADYTLGCFTLWPHEWSIVKK